MAIGFFAVFDDIAVLLDDAAAMSKIATKKTAGVLGDDLAVGAENHEKVEPVRETKKSMTLDTRLYLP